MFRVKKSMADKGLDMNIYGDKDNHTNPPVSFCVSFMQRLEKHQIGERIVISFKVYNVNNITTVN